MKCTKVFKNYSNLGDVSDEHGKVSSRYRDDGGKVSPGKWNGIAVVDSSGERTEKTMHIGYLSVLPKPLK